MRYLWVDWPDNPNWDKCAEYGIDGLFFDPRPRPGEVQPHVIDKKYLEEVNARGFAVGIYIGAGWGELGQSPTSYINKAIEWMKGLRKSNSFPKVQWDLERIKPNNAENVQFILDVLRKWRVVFPWQDTSWTLEPGQGGLFGKEFIEEVTQKLRVRVVPQLFGGAMQAFDVEYVKEDLRNFPPQSISLCHDAARLGIGWKGFAFTQGRLP